MNQRLEGTLGAIKLDRNVLQCVIVIYKVDFSFGKFIQADSARWSALARERRISLDDRY